ncbi:MAG: PhoU domain-containing protein, partial [Bacteroidales bacterium]
RNDLLEMWNLVISQMTKAQQAFLNTDKELAREIGYFEKKVDVFELKIDKDCELYIALNNPVAIDLRFVLSILKINTALERLGDFAKGISRRVIDYPVDKPNSDLMKIMQVDTMFENAICMMVKAKEAFEKEDAKLATCIFVKDDILDEINRNADHVVLQTIQKNPELSYEAISMLSIIRKL